MGERFYVTAALALILAIFLGVRTQPTHSPALSLEGLARGAFISAEVASSSSPPLSEKPREAPQPQSCNLLAVLTQVEPNPSFERVVLPRDDAGANAPSNWISQAAAVKAKRYSAV